MTNSSIYGMRMLKGGIAISLLLAIAMITWTVDKALSNPDVQTKRPSWLDSATGFEVSFWIPLFLTISIGVGLVTFVFLRAARRIGQGEDLYANRMGKRVRRRGERHLRDSDEQL